MDLYLLDIEAASGARSQEVLRTEKTILGRLLPSQIRIDDPLVSDVHCEVVREGQRWWLRDLDSTNGTFVNGERIGTATEIREGSAFEIGTSRFRFRKASASEIAALHGGAVPGHGAAQPGAPRVSTLRSDEGRHAWMVRRDRYLRWANDWESQGHARKLLARGPELLRLREWQAQAQRLEISIEVQINNWMAASRDYARKSRRIGWAGALMSCAAATVVVHQLSQDDDVDATPSSTLSAPSTLGADSPFASDELLIPDEDSSSRLLQPVKREWILHPLAPGETLNEVAARYEVSPALLAQWNELNPDQPDLKTGQELKVIPRRPALPPQRIEYQVETGEDFQTLAQRFGIALHKLQLYNPEVKKIAPGQTLVIWVDPAPLGLKTPNKVIEVPEVSVAQGGISHGLPQQGWIENSVQIPESPLYKRRFPPEMFTSSHMLQHLVQGVTLFRQRYEWEGTLVLADASLKSGGPIQPHKSHQSGRDIDIWLPTLRGVYKDSHLGVDRRPNPNEADWFVTWYLVESLLSTKQIRNIFLSYEIQENLYTAAKISGRTDEELRSLIQWPNGNTRAAVSHADGHIHHIHVRFRCPKDNPDCRDSGAVVINGPAPDADP